MLFVVIVIKIIEHTMADTSILDNHNLPIWIRR